MPLTFQHSDVSESRRGTKLILSDLREPEIWQAEQHLQNLQRKLSGMISPFQEADDFRVHLEIDGKSIELAAIAESVRNTALIRYAFQFDGEVFHMSGVVRLNYLRAKQRG